MGLQQHRHIKDCDCLDVRKCHRERLEETLRQLESPTNMKWRPSVYFELIMLNKKNQVTLFENEENILLEKAINKNTILVSIMHANNEIGSIQPIKKIGSLCKKHNIIFHVVLSK